jgi:para-nitrobenzyl esterase
LPVLNIAQFGGDPDTVMIFGQSGGGRKVETLLAMPSADVPVMVGFTRTEWTGLTTDAALWHLDDSGMRARIKEMVGDQGEAMINLYRKNNPEGGPTDIFFLIASDFNYGAKTMKIAERRAALGKGPVYHYYFAWATPVQGGLLKSPHNIEWPFAFDNVKICANLTGGGPEAMALADKVSDAWIAFARTGNPNIPKLPHWPMFDPEGRATMVFDNASKVVNDPLREQRIAMFRALDLT